MRRLTRTDLKASAIDTLKVLAIVALFSAVIFSSTGMKLLGYDAMPTEERVARAAILLTATGVSAFVGNILMRWLEGAKT